MTTATRKTTRFMLLADPQLGIAAFLLRKHAGRTTPSHHGEMVAPAGSQENGWPYEEERLSRVIEVANELKPDFIVVLGDMVMHWDDALQIASVKEAARRLSPAIPLHWVPGNHDVGVDFFSATDESLAAYRASFGPDRYAFTAGPCRFVAFNSALFDRPDSARHEYEAQLEWLEQELARPLPEGVHHTVVFAHHPPFLRDIGEEYGVYNLPQPQRRLLVDLLTRNGVEYYFAGHTHANVLTRHEALRVTATSAIGVSRSGHASGYRLVEADSQSISHSFHPLH
ncbi:MAG: metallophosphoesterase [Chloroflexi bacterium]|nr:metallophosphoesterase [Chloroflexota bacterium]MDA1297307.1 metallophosphoesterase [Chloroflexota bacterium]